MSKETDSPRLRLAVQKKGRLADDTFDLLAKCGLKVRHGRSRLFARIEELPIDVLLVRDDDIPELVASGAADAGIVGGNVFEEDRLTRDGVGAVIADALGFSRCRLCVAVSKGETYAGPAYFSGKKVATSYPGLLQSWLEERGVTDAQIVLMHGAHEIAPRLGLADAICDIVSTGATLDTNGLKVADTIYRSEALLIAAPGLDVAKAEILGALKGRMRGALASQHAKYVMMNAPRSAIPAITAVLPGADSPTILELAGEGDMVAIHSVCNEDVLWEHLAELKSVGASAILVLDIDKMLN
ncbi:ATP phosphoribosyltransferase [Parvularcula marina]|uniref:ATP phosphoribosyltransferase n=1 Tax=Parvularcula marina TaxID=2292771 RepID=UPI00351600E0